MRYLARFLAIVALLAGSPFADAEPLSRYVGRLANGQFISGAALHDWHATEANPRLDQQALFAPENPFRWLRDRALPLPRSPRAFLETHSGDRLPGVVLEHHAATDSLEGLPPHFVVEPDVELKPPRPYFPSTVRVVADSVRRIVWRKATQDRYVPGTVFFRDGRSLTFHSVRFQGAAARLLLAEGQHEASFNEIAEIHLPHRDPWEAHFDELAFLCPGGDSRLLQVETTDGLMATASRERCFIVAEGGPGDSDRWIHGLQPAWSLDLLWAPNRTIVMRRSFAPHEVPLSRIPPRCEPRPSPLRGESDGYATNRNIEGGGLECDGREYGWGFGVLGASELHFPMPECAVAFQSRVGLDRLARSGGAAQARLFLGDTRSTPAWRSEPLVGASRLAECGNLKLEFPSDDARTLILQTDPLSNDPPPGADPLDIRDVVDWLDPLIVLDPQKLQTELARRTPRRVFAWRGWSCDPDAPGEPIAWRNEFDLNSQRTSFQVGVASPDQTLRIARRVRPGATPWLVVSADQMPKTSQRATLEVRVEGEPAAAWEAPTYSPDPAHRRVLVLSLAPFLGDGEDVLLELFQSPTAKESPVYWRSAILVDQPPTLARLFEDEGDFEPAGGSPADGFSLEREAPYTGEGAVRVAASGRFRLPFARELPIRERPALNEFRYLRFAFRKRGKGRVAVELARREGSAPPIRYDAGLGEPTLGSAARVWSLELPDEWIVVTRDLFKDFGKADLTALTLMAPDGDHALFDHIYLARSENDFDALPWAPSPESTNRAARRELASKVLERSLPATVEIDHGGRFSTGVLISREGDVLTSGHAVVAPGKEVTVLLHDGRRLKAKTQGVARDLDLGLLRMEEAGEWSFVQLGDARNLPKNRLYLGVAHQRGAESQEAPAAHVLALQRVLDGVIWTDFDLTDGSTGGPLLDQDAKLIGIQRGRSQFGGFLYSQLLDIQSHLARMRNGETWGAWPAGSGPTMGVHVETLEGGCRVTEVYPDTPAASAGLRAGDWITKIDGRPVRRLDDIHQRLGEMDPGQQVSLEVRRGDGTRSVTVSVLPRVP